MQSLIITVVSIGHSGHCDNEWSSNANDRLWMIKVSHVTIYNKETHAQNNMNMQSANKLLLAVHQKISIW